MSKKVSIAINSSSSNKMKELIYHIIILEESALGTMPLRFRGKLHLPYPHERPPPYQAQLLSRICRANTSQLQSSISMTVRIMPLHWKAQAKIRTLMEVALRMHVPPLNATGSNRASKLCAAKQSLLLSLLRHLKKNRLLQLVWHR